jgi:molybdenum cofactor guanylyltransferase
VLLTGGASSRMGTDKATLVIDGEPLAKRVARVLGEVCSPVVEVGRGVSGLPHVDDRGSGPLAAFLLGVDALKEMTAPRPPLTKVHEPEGSGVRNRPMEIVDGPVVLLACDLPRINVSLVRALADAPGDESVVPVLDGRAQYACARWSLAAIAAARAAQATGGFRLAELATERFDALTDPQLLAVAVDVDTPDDLRRLGLP